MTPGNAHQKSLFLAFARELKACASLFMVLAAFLHLEASNALTITKQPQNTTLEAGQTLRLSVEYSGPSPSSVYWTRNNQVIAEAVSPNLRVTETTSAESGTYRAHLVHDGVTYSSDPALVSVNQTATFAVGYVNLEIVPGFQLITFPLFNPSTVAQAFGGLPPGLTIYKMDGNGFHPNYYFNGWSDPEMTIALGEAVFIHNARAESVTLTLTGSLPVGYLQTQVPAGFSAFGSMIPAASDLSVLFSSSPPVSGTVIYSFDKATQSFVSYVQGSGTTSPAYAVGQGWICYSPHEQLLQKYFDIDFGYWHVPVYSVSLLVLPPLRGDVAQFFFNTFNHDDRFGRVLEIGGTRPIQGNYSAQIYLGAANDESLLQPIGSPVKALNRSYDGRIHTKLVNVPAFSSGDAVYAQLRVWETRYGTTFEQAVQNGSRHGKSAVMPYTLRAPVQNNQPSAPPLPFNNFPTFSVQLGSDKSTRLTEIAKEAGGLKLWFIGAQGKKFRILYKESMTAPNWNVLPGAETLNGNNTEVTFTDPAANSRRFYRIQQLD